MNMQTLVHPGLLDLVKEVKCDSFGVEDVPEEIKELIGNKNIISNIFCVQANNSIMCGYFYIGFIDFMLAGKKLTDFISLFSPYDFQKNGDIILSYFKVNECNFIELNKTNLTDQTKYRLNEITEIENYFIEEINQRKSRSKQLSKYIAAFDYIDETLIVLSATSGGVSIISFTSVVGTLKIFILAKSKLNSIETLVFQALIGTKS